LITVYMEIAELKVLHRSFVERLYGSGGRERFG
jgi:hypothetical protein